MDHTKKTHDVGLASSIFPTEEYLWNYLDGKQKEGDTGNDPSKDKNKNKYLFYIAYSRYFYKSIYRVINRLNIF